MPSFASPSSFLGPTPDRRSTPIAAKSARAIGPAAASSGTAVANHDLGGAAERDRGLDGRPDVLGAHRAERSAVVAIDAHLVAEAAPRAFQHGRHIVGSAA